jgi:hypothetical protein
MIFCIPALAADPRSPGRRLSMNLLLIFTLFSQTAFAQEKKRDWDEVMKIAPGSKLKIKTKPGQKLSGKLSAVTADSITLYIAKAP